MFFVGSMFICRVDPSSTVFFLGGLIPNQKENTDSNLGPLVPPNLTGETSGLAPRWSTGSQLLQWPKSICTTSQEQKHVPSTPQSEKRSPRRNTQKDHQNGNSAQKDPMSSKRKPSFPTSAFWFAFRGRNGRQTKGTVTREVALP